MIKSGAIRDPSNLVKLTNYDLYKWFPRSGRRGKNFYLSNVCDARAGARNGILKEHNLKSLLSHGETLNEWSKYETNERRIKNYKKINSRVINYISTRANYVRRRINLLIVEFQPDRVIDGALSLNIPFLCADFELLFRCALRKCFASTFVLVEMPLKHFLLQ